jgi:hypothetical protein
MLKINMNLKKILVVSALSLITFLLLIFRSHLGFISYLYSHITNNETRLIEKKLERTLKAHPKLIFEELKQENKTNPTSSNVCHGILHKLGHQSFEIYGLERSMSFASPYCGSGFIHGVLEAKFKTLDDSEILDTIHTICEPMDQPCNHGIGHGLMILTHNKFETALSYCDKLEKEGQSDCFDGVFMHIFDNEETGISKKIKERRENIGLCQRVDEHYKKSCYFYVPRIYAREEKSEINSQKLCNQVKGEYHILCVVGAGTMFGKYNFADEDLARSMCNIFDEDKKLCEEGITLYLTKVFKEN